MEGHIIEILRYLVYILTVVATVIILMKVQYNATARRLTALIAVVLVYFNYLISIKIYFILAAAFEAIISLIGVMFVLILALVIMLLPVLIVIHWLTH